MNYYFGILFFSFIIPAIFSFHPKLRFDKQFYIIIRSIPLTSIPFIIWDIFFTHTGIWGFNKLLISNIYLFNLPIEEVLFFVIIPFCCLYTFHVIELYKISFFKKLKWTKINLLISSSLLLIVLFNYSNRYTFYCLILCAAIILLDTYYLKKIDYNIFNTFFIILFIPFVIVNGALTGLFLNQQVVWYNDTDKLNIFIFTIPIEDLFYSYLMNISNVIVYKTFIK